MPRYRRIIVVCPNGVTGGPELLHQFVHELRLIGQNAYIAYFPFGKPHECPEVYREYAIPQVPFEDREGDLVIVPEVLTRLLRKIRNAEAAVWWLSVDYYYQRSRESFLRDLFMRYKTLLYGRLPLHKLESYRHYAQSYYAKQYLESNGLHALMLSDCLNTEHDDKANRDTRKNIIAYNPKKGWRKSRKLISRNRDLSFVAIEKMSRSQVRELLQSAMIYMDFGNHPGKDRLPREAAIAGCCVITGRQGSAENQVDISIPDEYKLDDSTSSYLHRFRPVVDSIFSDFDKHSSEFDLYRSVIMRERETFKSQVMELFGSLTDCREG